MLQNTCFLKHLSKTNQQFLRKNQKWSKRMKLPRKVWRKIETQIENDTTFTVSAPPCNKSINLLFFRNNSEKQLKEKLQPVKYLKNYKLFKAFYTIKSFKLLFNTIQFLSSNDNIAHRCCDSRQKNKSFHSTIKYLLGRQSFFSFETFFTKYVNKSKKFMTWFRVGLKKQKACNYDK